MAVQARRYLLAAMSGLPSLNGWRIAEFIGDKRPDKTQRFLNRASWDEASVMSEVRRFGAAGLDEAAAKRRRRKGRIRVAALDETGQEKKGECTSGVKRQHMGCAGGVANGINTVHLSYVREKIGHVLAGFRQWIPEEQAGDVRKSLPMAFPLDLEFMTKGELAVEILKEAYADGLVFDFVCGDEVYGSSPDLREFLESEGQAYVLRVRKNFPLPFKGEGVMTCGDAVKKLIRPRNWEVRSAGRGSKGERWYAWAWIRVDERHCLLVRRHLGSGDLAFHYCWMPAGKRMTMTALIRAAGLRWPAEEGFEFSKDCFGLDQSQVRLYHAVARHAVMVLAAFAVCAVTAALLGSRTDTQEARPITPDQSPPADFGLAPLTVPEIGRLLACHPPHSKERAAHWSDFRRAHYARASWYHQRARLARAYEMSQFS